MKENILFSERQRFTQWWLWLILVGINTLFIYGLYKRLIIGEPVGTNPASDVSGTSGLQLEFIGNKKLLIGTKKPEELELVLNDHGQLKK
jgi:hypothetical protein